ncbi:hypothetical protein BJH93_04720 [Kocuria polaris]|nr:hypothetical protein [Kocuria polaris]
MDPGGAPSVLGFVEVLDGETEKTLGLDGPPSVYYQYCVDGVMLPEFLNDREDVVGPTERETLLRIASPETTSQQLSALLGETEHELRRDPWLLYCACGDPGCGGISVRVTRRDHRVLWSNFAWAVHYSDDDYFGEYLQPQRVIAFDADQYDAAIRAASDELLKD